jgi:hypothetical protein
VSAVASRIRDAVGALAVPLLGILIGVLVSRSGSLGLVVLGAAMFGAVLIIRPREAIIMAVGLTLVFAEETWQLRGSGQAGSPTVVYAYVFWTLPIQVWMVVALALRTFLDIAIRQRARITGYDKALLLVLASTVLGEVYGRFSAGYWHATIGQATAFAAPVIAALVMHYWFSAADVRRALPVVGWIIAARMTYGLTALALGGGDVHREVGIRIPFWDAADGLLGVISVVAGLEIAVNAEEPLDALKGIAFASLGIAVIVLSARRAAMVSVVAAVAFLFLCALAGHRSRKRLGAYFAVLAFASATVLLPGIAPGYSVGSRFLSSFVVEGGTGSNPVHFAELADGAAALARSPLMGYGYHVYPERTVAVLMDVTTTTEAFSGYHNLLINLWVKNGSLGIIGLVASVWLAMGGVVAYLRAGAEGRYARVVCALLVAMTVAGVTGSLLWGYRMPWFFWLALTALAIILAPRTNSFAAVTDGALTR